ncbi:hypothetical protein T484DRAFT_1849523 [Baffinella frigidus]|nr:hypothetical protein T484DRAFT_1849523 [Cryptophyta sp. CCMP2293]
MGEPEYLAIGLGTGVFTFFFWNLLVDCFNLSQDDAFFFWWDTVGISAFCVIGAMHGIRAGLHPFIVAM